MNPYCRNTLSRRRSQSPWGTFAVSLLVALLLITTGSLLWPVAQHEPSGSQPSASAEQQADWATRISEQAKVADQSRQAVRQLQQQLENMRNDFSRLQERHDAQSRELQKVRSELRALRDDRN